VKRFAVLAFFASALAGSPAFGDEPYTICSITINSSDEIETFRKLLPAEKFRFVELPPVDAATAEAAQPGSWFGSACESGVQCDVLVVSGHFGNTYAGNYGTTFAGTSGLTLPIGVLERSSCDERCSGILKRPLEVFLFGCRTLSPGFPDRSVRAADVALLGGHGVPRQTAERILEEARVRATDADTRVRMSQVFAGVPQLYGFSEAGPLGKTVQPLLESYLRKTGDYAAHLARLAKRRAASDQSFQRHAAALERELTPSSFTQTGGLDPSNPAWDRHERTCHLVNERKPLPPRLDHVEALFRDPEFLSFVAEIEWVLRAHPAEALGPAERAPLDRLRANEAARGFVLELVDRLETPVLRLELASIARSIGWIDEARVFAVQRDVIVRALRPPAYGEGRDLVCGLDPVVRDRLNVTADDLWPETYADEFAIQALGCLKAKDERIRTALGNVLFDSREWIARAAAIALLEMKPVPVDVQVALARQLGRPQGGVRDWAARVLRESKSADARVVEAIRATDPTFTIDWL
jgi:hypothetical protein